MKIQDSILKPIFFNEKDHPEIKDVSFNTITTIGNKLYFLSEKGIFIFDHVTQKFLPDSLLFDGFFSGKNYNFLDIFKFKNIIIA